MGSLLPHRFRDLDPKAARCCCTPDIQDSKSAVRSRRWVERRWAVGGVCLDKRAEIEAVRDHLGLAAACGVGAAVAHP